MKALMLAMLVMFSLTVSPQIARAAADGCCCCECACCADSCDCCQH